MGAHLNVIVNCKDLEDAGRRAAYVEKADALRAEAEAQEAKILKLVTERLGQ